MAISDCRLSITGGGREAVALGASPGAPSVVAGAKRAAFLTSEDTPGAHPGAGRGGTVHVYSDARNGKLRVFVDDVAVGSLVQDVTQTWRWRALPDGRSDGRVYRTRAEAKRALLTCVHRGDAEIAEAVS